MPLQLAAYCDASDIDNNMQVCAGPRHVHPVTHRQNDVRRAAGHNAATRD